MSEQDLKSSITEIESTSGRYTNLLIDPYLQLARIYLGSGRLEDAEKSLRQAQHLTHRDDGVYAMSQLEIVDLLTQLDLMQEKIKQAEGQQQFALQINKHNVEENSLELIPAFLKLAEWQLDTGQFYRSRSTLDQLEILITTNSGAEDIRMVEALRLRAKSRLLQGICCAANDLEKAAAIMSKNPSAGDDYAELLFDLGDAYIASNDPDLATDIYNKAWQVRQQAIAQLSEDSPPRQLAMFSELGNHPGYRKKFKVNRNRFGQPTYQDLSPLDPFAEDETEPQYFVTPGQGNQYNIRIQNRKTNARNEDPIRKLIGEPVQFDYKQLLYLLPAAYKNDNRMKEISIQMDFTVNEQGRTSDVTSETSNAPIRLNKLMTRVVRDSRFRPAFKAGKAINTHHVNFTQTFSPYSDIISQRLPVLIQ